MKTFIRILSIIIVLSISTNMDAQIDVKGKIRDKVNERAENHVDNAIDKGLDAAEKGISDAVTNDDGDEEMDSEKETIEEDAEEETESDVETKAESKSKANQDKVTLQSYTKYDFVPGDKVLYFEDFSQDAVGDFPAQWTSNGSGEVKTLNIAEGHWLHMNAEDAVYCLMPEVKMPENFIFEFDVIPTPAEEDGDICTAVVSFFNVPEEDYTIDDLYPGETGVHVSFKTDGWDIKGYAADKDWKVGDTEKAPVVCNEVNHIIIWVQKSRVRIYHKGQKCVDMPTVLYTPCNFNRLRFSLWDQEGAPYISNIRITTAGADTRSKLLTEGKLVSYGIYFDVNKDIVKPESYGALNDIAKVLQENPDVKVRIVGHTDSDGADAANLDLSKRRAASVKNELVKSFGIEASRIEADGKGESSPIAPNDTPSNKSLNRRVEFIKL